MYVNKHSGIRYLIGVFPVPELTLAGERRYFSERLWTGSIQLSQLLWADVKQGAEQIWSCRNGPKSDILYFKTKYTSACDSNEIREQSSFPPKEKKFDFRWFHKC